MRGGAQVVGQISVGFDRLERCRGSEVAVFADQGVDGLVFTEFLYSRSKNDQFRSVGQSHAGAIDGLVAEPGGVELTRIEIDDGFLDRLVEHLEVHLKTQFRSKVEALDVIADKQTAHG